VAAFEGVGATRPVVLDRTGKRLLLEVVEFWLRSGVEQLAPGIFELRNALLDDRSDSSDGGTDPSATRPGRHRRPALV
jgi:hypothetical protein